jgi:hypothetical protein
VRGLERVPANFEPRTRAASDGVGSRGAKGAEPGDDWPSSSGGACAPRPHHQHQRKPRKVAARQTGTRALRLVHAPELRLGLRLASSPAFFKDASIHRSTAASVASRYTGAFFMLPW